jgi:hypothetical protein
MLSRMSRWAPLTGAVFAVLAAVAFASSNVPPGRNASGDSVITFFKAHHAGQVRSDYLWFLAFAFLLLFAASFRDFLRRSPAADTMGPLVMAGAAVLVGGATAYFGFDFTLALAPNHLEPGAAQALNELALSLFFPFAAGGFVFGIGAGLAILRGGQLPAWLGWVAILMAVVMLTPGALGAIVLLILWAPVISVLLFRRSAGPVVAG